MEHVYSADLSFMVELPSANHYVFLSNEGDVFANLRAFAVSI